MRHLLLFILTGISLIGNAQIYQYLYNTSSDYGDRFLGYKSQFYTQGDTFKDNNAVSVHFNAAGQPDTIHYIHLDKVDPSGVRYTYHHSNGKLTSFLQHSVSKYGVHLNDSFSVGYHSSGLISSKEHYAYVDSLFKPFIFEQYYRLPDGRDTLYTKRFFSELFGPFFQRETRKTYNANGRLASQLHSQDTGSGPYPTYRITVSYPNANDSFVTSASYDQLLQKWDTVKQELHYKNSPGQDDSLILFVQDTVTKKLVRDKKFIYEYANGKIVTEYQYEWDSSNQKWIISRRINFDYTASGELEVQIGETIDSAGNYIVTSKNEYEFNSYGDPISQTLYKRFKGQLSPQFRFLLNWKNPLGFLPEEHPIALNVYPVPATEAIQFDLDREFSQITLQIFDLSGKKVSELTGSGKHLIWQIPHRLKAGSYIYRLRAGNGLVSGKVVVIKE